MATSREVSLPLRSTSTMHGSTTQGSHDGLSTVAGMPDITLASKDMGTQALSKNDWENILKQGNVPSAGTDPRRPLHLLDLPLDILSLIVKEISHTNDLCALAITHSALHSLATPHIYSRFDIVWPDATTSSEPRAGVDALTYGLATLVMAEEVFGEAQWQKQAQITKKEQCGCIHCGYAGPTTSTHDSISLEHRSRKEGRRGNHYAMFTRKFSLGNGPAEWVQEYLATKEAGKMLGTLVALALARMRNLETFIWDMPTGILRDVWTSLASLADREDGQECRLEKVWVRWHNNALVDGNVSPPASARNEPGTFPLPVSATGAAANMVVDPATSRPNATIVNEVERPTFSVLPPIRSLNVFDIDELAYLDEMSDLINRSKHCLRELRVSIASEAAGCDWTGAWEGDSIQQLPAKDSDPLGGTSHYEKRLGGVMGVLVGHFHSIAGSNSATIDEVDVDAISPATQSKSEVVVLYLPKSRTTSKDEPQAKSTGRHSDKEVASSATNCATSTDNPSEHGPDTSVGPTSLEVQTPAVAAHGIANNEKEDTQQVVASSAPMHLLAVRILELQRIPLSVPALCGAFDWLKLTALTILDCPNHAQLWKILRLKFAPRENANELRTSPGNRRSSSMEVSDWGLKLRKLHTNCVTTSLVAFLKDALAPNSLESLFLQQSKHYTSKISIDAIFRGPIRRHRGSIRELSIDSRYRDRDKGVPATGFRKWAFDRDMIDFATGGRMPQLRELAMTIDIKDWHFFLQRLPSLPHLHALYIPFILKESSHVANQDEKELALQVIDIITLRPEIELRYLAIAGKCFEVFESRLSNRDDKSSDYGLDADSDSDESDNEDNDDDDDDDDDDDIDDHNDGNASGDDAGGQHEHDSDDENMETEDDADSDSDGSEIRRNTIKSQPKLKLREILFYDDKVAIFKARHGKL